MYITYLLLGITILVSIRFMEDSVEKRRLMLNPYDVVNYQKWYRCFTHAFIHADWMHLIFNMYVLYMFGASITEHQFGYVSRLSLEPALIADFGAEGYLYFGCLYVGAILFTSTISPLSFCPNAGYFRFKSSKVSATILATIALIIGLLSAGITYHGASFQAVFYMASRYACTLARVLFLSYL